MSDMRGSPELCRALRNRLLTYPFHTCGAGFEGLDELEPIAAIQEKEISLNWRLEAGGSAVWSTCLSTCSCRAMAWSALRLSRRLGIWRPPRFRLMESSGP